MKRLPLALLVIVLLALPAVPQVPTAPGPVGGPGGNWRLIFSDEFDGTSLDMSKWNTCYPDFRIFTVGNGCRHGRELQWYNADDVIVQEGMLRLRAQRRSVSMSGLTFTYTSGMIASHGKFSFQYGYMEARVKVPKGRALWPAFWAVPASHKWPPEIDVMEIAGHEPNKTLLVYHYLDDNGKHQAARGTFAGPDFSRDWHVFAADWLPGVIVWFVDGTQRHRFISRYVTTEPMYLIINLAVGGVPNDWVGIPDADTPFPSYVDVDYVRVWQR